MQARILAKNVELIGAVDWDRRVFDSLIPLPDGTSYNAYLVRGSEKTVLIDTVDPAKTTILMEQLATVTTLDFVIANHAEQDHSGSLGCVLDKYKNAVLLCSPKCKDMLVDLLHLAPERIRVVSDGETLSLGDKTLEFMLTPWVHWPETMVTYCKEDQILFSCDFFGSHLATNETFVTNEACVAEAAKRYYAEIMMPFRTMIKKNIEKVEQRPIAMIAPSHGPVYGRPAFIIDAYKEWIGDTPRNVVVVPYISMHDSTRAMVARLITRLTHRNIAVHQFDLAVTDIGKLAITLVDAATIVIGTPTVHMGPHPLVSYAAGLANALRPKAKFACIIGSYGWATKAVEQITGAIGNLKVEVLESIMVKGYPREAEFTKIDALADLIAEKHTAAGILK